MNSENQKGLVGTIIFHGFLFLCVFLMSFAGPGGGGNSTGEALGGIEVSLGEPDLGGPDTERGYSQEEESSAPEKTTDDQTLTEDDATAPEIKSDKPETKPVVPKVTAPVYKKTTPTTTPKRIPNSKSLYTKKGGNVGGGKKEGSEGEPDGNPFKDGNGGTSDKDGPKGPGGGDDGNTDGNPGLSGDLKGLFRKDRAFDIKPDRPGSGSVQIRLCVNRDGSVRSALSTGHGTLQDKYFIDLAIKAVKANSYTPQKQNMPETTCGLITFNFKKR